MASIAASAAGTAVVAPRPETQPVVAEPAKPSTPPASLHSNPVSSINLALGIVVLNFYNDSGEVTQSIPSQKQLDLYRQHEASISPNEPSAGA